MDAEAAARRWVDGWTRGWQAHDPEPIVALYAPEASFVSTPFREPKHGPDGVREYVEWAFAEEDEVEVRFGEPRLAGDAAVVEYWAWITFRGALQTLAGVSLIRFDAQGLVREQRDYWHVENGRREPAPGWGQ